MTGFKILLTLSVCLSPARPLWAGPAPGSLASAPAVRKDLEGFAARFKFFIPVEFLYDRCDVHTLPKAAAQDYRRLMAEFNSRRYNVSALIELLKHEEPRARTLAVAALYATEDPKQLPHIAALVSDKARTFPRPDIVIGLGFGAPQEMPPLREQTVGDIAAEIVDWYLEAAEFFQGTKGDAESFKAYWAPRKDRPFCASWFRVKLWRAGQGTRPTAEERKVNIRALRQQIDRIPRLDRAWTLLYLASEAGAQHLASDQERLEACKELGPERLALLLRRQVPSGDPDLQWRRHSHGQYDAMTLYVLQRAADLLRKQDAKQLLAGEQWLRSPWWMIAAADLERDKASALLHEGFGRFKASNLSEKDNRLALALALWRLVGPSETAFLVDWFYTDQPELTHFAHHRAQFLRGIAHLREPENRKLMVRIVQDKRLETLDWQSLDELIRTLNSWVAKPIVDAQVLATTAHPLGMGHFDENPEQARKKYPRETQALLDTFHEWRSKVRASIPQWSK
jgi:hypothetical protein